MNAKDNQKEIVAKILKPLFKEWGYKTSGQSWWKINGEFFNIVNLQNFSWNSKDKVDFCFNFSIGLSKNLSKKTTVTIHDGITHNREPSFLSDTSTSHRDKLGYHLTLETNIENFSKEIYADFESLILPKLDSLNSVDALLDFHKKGIFADQLRVALKREGFIK